MNASEPLPMTRPTGAAADAIIEQINAAAYRIPLEQPHADGTLSWSAVTLVVVHLHAGDHTGLGYTYAPAGAARVIDDTLGDVVVGASAMDIGASWHAMAQAVRNQGLSGPVAAAISAVDVAMWDLKARLLGVALAHLLQGYRPAVPIYGSGGFTNLSLEQLEDQLTDWVQQGLGAVKIKVGTDPTADPKRVAFARRIIGEDTGLFVDANGAYSRKQALAMAEEFSQYGVSWFEEPVSSDDVAGLHLLRNRGPAGMDITAGEYGWNITHFRGLLAAEAVDCLQADVTRCGGITGLLRVAALCDAENIAVSAHCAPQISAHAMTGVWHGRHLEYFADHVYLEQLAFEGNLWPTNGLLQPDRYRPGHGLTLREDAVASLRTY